MMQMSVLHIENATPLVYCPMRIAITVDSAYLQSLFVRENFAIKQTLR